MPFETLPPGRWLLEAGLTLALRGAQTLLTPAIAALLLVRFWQGKEDRHRLPERLGWCVRRRPAGPLLWLHAASVGEVTALVPLLRELEQGSRQRGLPPPALLVTSVSRSSARMAPQLLPEGVIHQCAPVDHWLALALFRRHWRPDLGVLVEAELWPELVRSMPRLHLVNARMSERSFRRHRRLPWFAAWLYGRARHCWAQSEADAARLRQLGASGVEAVGSTKRDADPPVADAAIVARLLPRLRGRKVLLLASSHPGEERLLLQAWPRLRQGLGRLTLLLVPRHPERAASVLREARQAGLATVLWTELAPIEPVHQGRPDSCPDSWTERCTDSRASGPSVRGPDRSPGTCDGQWDGGFDERSAEGLDALVVDRLGAMGSWLAVADLVLMGGSLAAGGRCVGGHNPLEPIRAGRQVVCGPDMANFIGLTEELQASGWLHRLPSAEALGPTLLELLRSPPPPPPPLALRGPCRRIARHLLDALPSPA